MVSTFTPNIQLEEPARGDDVGTWDTPVNANMSLVDLTVGGLSFITIAGAPIVLAPAQFQCKTLVFLSTLTASITITFPTSFAKSYEIYNQATGSSNFTITLRTTSAFGASICAPPGEIVDAVNIPGGFGLQYRNLGRVGSYWDHGGSSVPNWVSGCSLPPYLNCDGTSFSSALYPTLTTVLGGTTLPDSRGRARFAMNQTTSRLTSAGGGLDGDTKFAAGGAQTLTIGTSNLPPYTPSGTIVSSFTRRADQAVLNTAIAGANNFAAGSFIFEALTGQVNSSFTGTAQGGVSNTLSEIPPAYVGGITMIRAG